MTKPVLLLSLTAMTLMLLQACGPDKKGGELPSADFEGTYPNTRRDTVADDFFGTRVADPYRWLEDDNSPETVEWVKAQNAATFGYLDKIPYREALKARLTDLWNYEKFGTPFKKNGKYYFFKNDGLQNQSILYVQDALDAEARLVIDPNKLSADGTTSLGAYSFSKDGAYMAYATSEAGSDWRTIYVQKLADNSLTEDKVEWGKFTGISWYKDGFFYSRYPKPEEGEAYSGANLFHQVYYHKLGTPQSADELVYADRNNGKLNFYANTTEDERFLIISAAQSTSGNALYFKDLSANASRFTKVVDDFDHDYNVVDNVGDELYVLTNDQAPRWRLVAINTKSPAREQWRDIIPQGEHVLRDVSIIGGKIVAGYTADAYSKVKIFGLDGRHERDIELPGIGTVGGFSGDKDDEEAFYSFSSFVSPPTIFRYDMATGESSVFKQPAIDFDFAAYETKQVFYLSKDSTRVPMFITMKKGTVLDGNNPTLLYGYGGFDISITPSFSISRLALLENGGIFAVANIRGGGEYGAEWHKAGTLERKQNVFDDFIAAAEYLVAEKYSSPAKLAIEGRSNGGLLVGACMTQRPDLFAVAFPGVGVLDMLRYHKFTIGRAWAGDYGLSETPEGFAYLSKYSPLHNVRPDTEYPATMITTADHDDRVVPAHSFKFAAELQHQYKGQRPMLIRIETGAGHGAGKPTDKVIQESADLLAFMLFNMREAL